MSRAVRALLALLPLAPGCAFLSSYPAATASARNAFESGDFEAALRRLPEDPSGGNRVLFRLERGLVAHTAGDFEGSRREFEEAIAALRDFEGRPVVSGRGGIEAAGSVVLNDLTLPYDGEGFERVLLHAYQALNYLYRGDAEGALVECKRADAAQREEESRHGRRYETQGAFARYLSALVYEGLGDLQDAYVDYREVRGASPRFERVRRDLLRTAETLGWEDDLAKWRGEFGDLPRDGDPGKGEVVVLFQCGLGPIKVPIEVPVPTLHTLTKVAVPAYSRRPNPVARARLLAGGARVGETERLEDVEETAIENLKDRIAGIVAKAVARAAAKGAVGEVLVHRQRSAEAAFLVAVAAAVFNLVTEQADLRAWLTLPANFQVARVELPPGAHDLSVELIGEGGGVLNTAPLGSVEIRAGERIFVNLRSVGAAAFATLVAPGVPPEASP